MHILHLIKTSEGATWAIRLLESLKHRYPDLTFSVIIPKGGKHFPEYAVVCENVFEFEFVVDKTILSAGSYFKDIVRKLNPDIIHSWFTQTTLYARLFLRELEIPRLFQVAGPAHLENWMFRTGDIKSAQRNDYWIATSKYIFEKYKSSGIDDSKIFLNYAFIDVEKLLDSKKIVTPIDYIDRFNLDSDTKVIGTASYIYPPKFYESTGIKGHELLLDAFKLLLKTRNDVVLVVGGSSFGGSTVYEEKLKQRGREIDPNRIFFTGKYTNVYEVIGNFDLFVYLSKSENLGGVFESLLFEIPTISSNKGALPELVINDKTGFNIDPTHTSSLVDVINHMLDGDFSTFRKSGKQMVMETFDKDRIIENTYDIYHKVLN